jgi:hypothetical protein
MSVCVRQEWECCRGVRKRELNRKSDDDEDFISSVEFLPGLSVTQCPPRPIRPLRVRKRPLTVAPPPRAAASRSLLSRARCWSSASLYVSRSRAVGNSFARPDMPRTFGSLSLVSFCTQHFHHATIRRLNRDSPPGPRRFPHAALAHAARGVSRDVRCPCRRYCARRVSLARFLSFSLLFDFFLLFCTQSMRSRGIAPLVPLDTRHKHSAPALWA